MPEKPPEKIHSIRLLMRKPMMEDASPIFQLYAQDTEVTKYLTWKPHLSITNTKTFLKSCLHNWQNGISFPWTIVRKNDKQLIGMLEIVNVDQTGIQLGYVLARPFWGKGYMTEALLEIIDWAFKLYPEDVSCIRGVSSDPSAPTVIPSQYCLSKGRFKGFVLPMITLKIPPATFTSLCVSWYSASRSVSEL